MVMRDYARIVPRFWVQGTGEKLRNHRDARTLALYLMSNPHSDMCGIYYLPIPMMAFELGFSEQEVRDALAVLGRHDIDFARFDESEHLVYLPEGARFQVGEALKPKDNNRKKVVKSLARYKDHAFVEDFWSRYADIYHLADAIESTPLAEKFGWVEDPSATPSGGVAVTPSGGVLDTTSGPLAKGSYARARDPVPVPVPVGGVGGRGELTPNEQKVWDALLAYPETAELAEVSVVQAIWATAYGAGRTVDDTVAVVRHVGAKATTSAADGQPWTRDAKRDRIASLAVSWRTARGSGQRTAEDPPAPGRVTRVATSTDLDRLFATEPRR